MTALIDITGQRFGSLVALNPESHAPSNRSKRWRCRCDCGRFVIKLGYSLRSGRTKSCGCLSHWYSVHNRPPASYVTRHPLYKTWVRMRILCQNPNPPKGQRIHLHPDFYSFEKFVLVMGERPKNGYLKRIDPKGDYSPDNVTWGIYKRKPRELP